LLSSSWISLRTLFSILTLTRKTCWKVFMLWLWLQYVWIYSLHLNSYFCILIWKVECGFAAHLMGAYTAPPHFNHENCWKPLEDFLENLDKIKESQWKTILQFHKMMMMTIQLLMTIRRMLTGQWYLPVVQGCTFPLAPSKHEVLHLT